MTAQSHGPATGETAPAAQPGARIVGLDVARCLALLGMIATHVLPGIVDGDVTVVQQVAGGRSSALFALLAGTSLALMSGRTEPVRGRERLATSAGLAVRALLIALLGLALGELATRIAVILTYYGVLFLFGLLFLGLRARALFVLSGAWLVVVPVLAHLVRPELPARGLDSPHFSDLAHPVQLLSELTFTGYYPAVPWVAYLLAGMALGRLDLSRTGTAVRLAVSGAVLAAVAWSASAWLLARDGVLDTLARTYDGPGLGVGLRETLEHGLYGSTPTGSWWWLAVAAPHTATPFDLAQTIGSALLVVGVCVLLAQRAPRAFAIVFGAGAMTLTLYSFHVVLRTPSMLPGEDVSTFVTHVLVVGGIGALFALVEARGPFEDGVRTVNRRVRAAVLRDRVATSAPP